MSFKVFYSHFYSISYFIYFLGWSVFDKQKSARGKISSIVTQCFVADILLLIFIFSCCWYLLSHKFVNQKCSRSFIAVVTFGMRLYFCPCLFTNIHYTQKYIYGITCVKREPCDMKLKTCISEPLNSPEENPSPLTHDQSVDTIVNTEVSCLDFVVILLRKCWVCIQCVYSVNIFSWIIYIQSS